MGKYILICAAFIAIISLSAVDIMAKSHRASKSDVVKKHQSKEGHKSKPDRFERPDREDPFLRMLSEELDLTEEQKTEITELLKAEREKFREEERDKREENHNKIVDLIKSDVLTPEQSAKLTELEAKRESGEFRENTMEDHLDRLSEDLQLTSEQKEKLAGLLKKQRPKRKVREENEKHHPAKMNKEKRDEFKERLAQILSPEQLTKFEEIRKEKMKDRKERRHPHDKIKESK